MHDETLDQWRHAKYADAELADALRERTLDERRAYLDGYQAAIRRIAAWLDVLHEDAR